MLSKAWVLCWLLSLQSSPLYVYVPPLFLPGSQFYTRLVAQWMVGGSLVVTGAAVVHSHHGVHSTPDAPAGAPTSPRRTADVARIPAVFGRQGEASASASTDQPAATPRRGPHVCG